MVAILTLTPLTLIGHAKRLGLSDPKDLVSCLQDTTSNTARQIIRLLYSPRELLEMSRTEIPASQRQAIRGMFRFDRLTKTKKISSC